MRAFFDRLLAGWRPCPAGGTTIPLSRFCLSYFGCACTGALLALSAVGLAGEAPAPAQPVPAVTGTASPPPAPPPPTLYQRMGGANVCAVLGEDLVERLAADEILLANPVLKETLAKTPKAALRFHAVSMLCALAGGPERYTGAQSPLALYRNLKLGDKEWNALGAALRNTLEAGKVGEAERKEFLEQLDAIHKALLSALETSGEYRAKDGSFSIVLPKDWERQDTPGGPGVLAISPAGGEKDTYRENLVVSVEDFPVEMTALEYAKAFLLVASKQLKDFKLVDSGPAVLGNASAHRLAYTHKSGNLDLIANSFFIGTKTRGYVISCLAAADQMEAFKAAFESALKSFKLGGPETSKEGK